MLDVRMEGQHENSIPAHKHSLRGGTMTESLRFCSSFDIFYNQIFIDCKVDIISIENLTLS